MAGRSNRAMMPPKMAQLSRQPAAWMSEEETEIHQPVARIRRGISASYSGK